MAPSWQQDIGDKPTRHATIGSVLRRLTPLAFLFLLLVPGVSAQTGDLEALTISGGDLPSELQVAPADADNFVRRLGFLPRLEGPPAASGPAYQVVSPYWEMAVRLEPEEEEAELSLGAAADYYPEGGFVRGELGGEAVWMVLNLRQRAILDRYIRLAREGLIGASPSTVELLNAVAATDEAFAVAAGAAAVDPDRAALLFERLAESNPTPLLSARQPPDSLENGFWLVVTLLEGRALRYFYDGETLTESLGTERYDASSIAGMLEAMAPASIPSIEQEKPAGSRLWWPVMVGGGLSAIGAAVWLRRRTNS